MGKLHLKDASEEDRELLWQWANDAETRRNSFNTAKISLAEHKEWFSQMVANNNIKIYIMLEDDVPVGQVRLSFDNKWQISYSIAPAFRGQGYEFLLLQFAENKLISYGHIGEELYAEVKKDNIASQRIFSKLGFKQIKSVHDDAYAYSKEIKRSPYEIRGKYVCGGAIVLLSNNPNSIQLLNWLEQRETVLFYSGILNTQMLVKIKPALVISFNYRHIVKPDILAALNGRIINVHISMLPWNRGSSPNLWSFIDNTPKGVTIHIMDEGLDTGDILYQSKLDFDEDKETLQSSYERLNCEAVKLLQDNWLRLRSFDWNPIKQPKGGSKHTMNDLQKFLRSRRFSYNMTIAEFKKEFGSKEN